MLGCVGFSCCFVLRMSDSEPGLSPGRKPACHSGDSRPVCNDRTGSAGAHAEWPGLAG